MTVTSLSLVFCHDVTFLYLVVESVSTRLNGVFGGLELIHEKHLARATNVAGWCYSSLLLLLLALLVYSFQRTSSDKGYMSVT